MDDDNVTPLPVTAYTRWNVNLVPPAVEARNRSAAREHRSYTDVANRALQLYDEAGQHVAAGGQLVFRYADGREEGIRLL